MQHEYRRPLAPAGQVNFRAGDLDVFSVQTAMPRHSRVPGEARSGHARLSTARGPSTDDGHPCKCVAVLSGANGGDAYSRSSSTHVTNSATGNPLRHVNAFTFFLRVRIAERHAATIVWSGRMPRRCCRTS